jgi:peptidoglycan/LPS O-acetylase OafA/YrhL
MIGKEVAALEAKPTLAYRADIDGLRAVAVLSVVFFHLKILKVWGGFIGVDVFFVISGFLISSVILKEISESRFSLSAFYQRRIRRIIPALMGMLGASTVAACIFLLPSELESFARSLLAASFSVSNFFFWLHSGYFDAPAADLPLLHTWSLAVEEQFYIFFPLFLVFVRRFFPGKFKSAIVALACASFVLSAIGAYKFPTSTFYLPMTRAWELLLGTILSLKLFPVITSRLWRDVASIAGLLMIIGAAFGYDVSTPFPGISALLPCVGAALIIAAGQHASSLAGRALASKPMVFIGLISYSFYIWHWPIIIFQRMSMIQVPDASSRSVKGVILLLSIVTATLSWRYIETPFRRGKLYLSGTATFKFAAVTTLGMIAAGGCILGFRGFPSRYSRQEIKIASYAKEQDTYRIGTCFLTSGNLAGDFDAKGCMRMDGAKKNYLLLGDSHAAQLWYGLANAFPDVNFLEATSSGCEPTLKHKVFDLRRCTVTMDYVFNDFLPKTHVDLVILAARWESEDMGYIGPTIEALKRQGINVVLFGPIVQYDSPLPRLLAVSLKNRNPSLPARHELTKYRTLDGEMASLASTQWNVPYVSFFKLLCPDNLCLEYAGEDVPIQFDYGHLTSQGSLLFGMKLRASGQLELLQPNAHIVSQ